MAAKGDTSSLPSQAVDDSILPQAQEPKSRGMLRTTMTHARKPSGPAERWAEYKSRNAEMVESEVESLVDEIMKQAGQREFKELVLRTYQRTLCESTLDSKQRIWAPMQFIFGGSSGTGVLPDVEWFSPDGTHVDWYAADHYSARLKSGATVVKNPVGAKNTGSNERVVKGGDPLWRVSAREGVPQTERPEFVGFRCVLASKRSKPEEPVDTPAAGAGAEKKPGTKKPASGL
jgi:hypothetical protein